MTDIYHPNGTVISACGQYRPRLERNCTPQGPTFVWFGVNPSTADAHTNDATVRKIIGFVTRWGGSRFILGNVFDWRATDVADLAKVRFPASLHNAFHLEAMIAEADMLVPAWGSRDKLPRALWPAVDALRARILTCGKPSMCLGYTASGDPLHPLMLGYDTAPVPF